MSTTAATSTPLPRLAPTLTVADLMTRTVIAMKISEPILEAEAEMRFARIRHVPVVDADHHVVGIASIHDFTTALRRAKEGQTIPLGAAMTLNVITVTAATPLAEAIETMLENKLSCLPVVDGKGRLEGILTEADYVLFVYHLLTGAEYARPF